MSNLRIKISLFLNYFVFAILLNSVGTVILQVQNNFNVSKGSASILEAFKDLSIAIASFLIASYVVRIGYKKTMLIALALVSAMCFIMPSVPSFLMTKLLFATVARSFLGVLSTNVFPWGKIFCICTSANRGSSSKISIQNNLMPSGHFHFRCAGGFRL